MVPSNPKKTGTSIVFFDVKPSEKIYIKNDDYLCFSSICPSSKDGVPKLKPFKRTKRSKKTTEAQRICNLMRSGSLKFTSFCIAGKLTGDFIHWAFDSLNKCRGELGFEWIEVEQLDKPVLRWNENTFNFPLASGISLYANLIGCMAIMYAIIAKNQGNIGHLKLALDNLPDDTSIGMTLIQEIIKTDPDLRKVWDLNLGYGVTFEIGNLPVYRDSKNKIRKGKYHPFAILCDWLAAGCMAKINPAQLDRNIKYTKREIAAISSIVDVAVSKIKLKIYDIDDPKVVEQIKSVKIEGA